jgi:hypothetical protein
MPINRKLLGAAAFSLALAGGGMAGAVLGTPSLSLAQDGEDEATTEVEDAPRPDHRRGHELLSTAAEAIGIGEDELRTALEEGQSIAQVAEANGVDVDAVVDAMVAAATERLEDAIEALPDRMAEVVEHEGFPERHRHRIHHPFGRDADPEAEGEAEPEVEAEGSSTPA